MSEKIIDEHNRLIMLRDQLRKGDVDPQNVSSEDLKRLIDLEKEEYNSRRASAILEVLEV